MLLKNDLAEKISLDGTWLFSLGDSAAWQEIQVPGCWESQGFSKLIEGPAKYKREFNIPSHWAGKTIQAAFGAVSYACTVSLNGVEVGKHQGLWTPFTVDLTQAVRLGELNTLEVVVYKPGEVYAVRSSLAGFIPDVSTTFGGIWQPVQITAISSPLADLRVRADLGSKTLAVHSKAVNNGVDFTRAEFFAEIYEGEKLINSQRREVPEDGTLDISVPIVEVKAWSPDQPTLYTVQVSLFVNEQLQARTSKRTGFRSLSAEGDQLLLNGEAVMLRGILSWGWEPDRIAPGYTPEQAQAEMRRVRGLGFNLIKLCLLVPTPAYFEAADEEGMLLWLEYPMWLPQVSEELRQLAPAEYAEITQAVHHHPSLVVYSLGCELSQAVDGELLGALNTAVRREVSNVLVCDNSGSGESYGGLDFDYADFTDYHPYYDLHYFEPLLDNWRRDWQAPRPWIFGEFCDSDTFRDLGELIQVNGSRRPWWLTEDNPVTRWRPEAKAMLEAEQRLNEAQTGFSTQELVRISYAQSLVIRKYTLELIRRRKGIGGYVVTGLRDTPISTSGVWDDFTRSKWTAEQFLPINGEAVLSLDGSRRRHWQYGGDRPDRLDIYNHWSGERAHWVVILSLTEAGWPRGADLTWSLTDDTGSQLASGTNLVPEGQLGKPSQVGWIDCKLPDVDRPKELSLRVLIDNKGVKIENCWPMWVYPPLLEPPSDLGILDPGGALDSCGEWLKSVHRMRSGEALAAFRMIITTSWEAKMAAYIQDGGRLLLLQQGEAPLPARRCPFWREAIKLFPSHPFWQSGSFPQKGFTDLQFFGLASDVTFDTARLRQALPEGSEINPLLRRLDAREFHVSEYLFEAVMGRGILLGCSLRLPGGVGAQPFGWERNVSGGAMFEALLRYLDEKKDKEFL
jgi:hypothetical protein